MLVVWLLLHKFGVRMFADNGGADMREIPSG